MPPVAGGADSGFGDTLIKKVGFGFGRQVIDEGFEVGVFCGALLAWQMQVSTSAKFLHLTQRRVFAAMGVFGEFM